MIGQRTLSFETVTSTFDIAWQYAHDAENHGLIVRADEQTQGKGQRGARWVAPAGSSLLVSVLLFPPPQLRRSVLLTLWAAVGVCRILEDLRLKPGLKWPNDVLLGGKKIGGVLVEQRQAAVVVGMGLNVNVPAGCFAQAGLSNAASVRDFTDNNLQHDLLLNSLIDIWENQYRLLEKDNSNELLHDWRRFSGLEGMEVEVTCKNEAHFGVLESLGFEVIRLKTPERMLEFSPEVSQRIRTIIMPFASAKE